MGRQRQKRQRFGIISTTISKQQALNLLQGLLLSFFYLSWLWKRLHGLTNLFSFISFFRSAVNIALWLTRRIDRGDNVGSLDSPTYQWSEVAIVPRVITPNVPPKSECGCLHGGVTENGRTRNPLTLCSVPALVHVQVWVHLPGDPQSLFSWGTLQQQQLPMSRWSDVSTVRCVNSPMSVAEFTHRTK